MFGWGGATAKPPTTIPLTGDWNGDGNTTVASVNSNGLQLNYPGSGTPAVVWLPASTVCSVRGGAGEACVYREVNAGGTAYRISMQLTPAAGSWMQPDQYNVAQVMRGSTGGWCGQDANGDALACAPQTAAWSSGWVETDYAAYVLVAAYTTILGTYHLYIGDTGWDTMSSQCATDVFGTVCVSLQGRFNAIGGGEWAVAPFGALAQYTPAARQSITPESVTVVNDADASTVNLCAPVCTAHTDPFSARAVLDQYDTPGAR
jgi:hypothetical protein